MAYYPIANYYGDASSSGPQGPPGVGFKLTPDGHFDMEGKILKNCRAPVDDNDAITKSFISEELVALRNGIRRSSESMDESFKNYTMETARKIQSLEKDLTRSVEKIMNQYTPSTYACATPPESGYSSSTFQKVVFNSFSNNLLNGPSMSFSSNAKAKITFFALMDEEKEVSVIARIWNANRLLKEIAYQGGQVAFIAPIVKDMEIKVHVKTDALTPEIYLKVEILLCT